MNQDNRHESLLPNLKIDQKAAKICAVDLIGCLKIWGLTYSDAVLVASEMIEALMEYEHQNKAWNTAPVNYYPKDLVQSEQERMIEDAVKSIN